MKAWHFVSADRKLGYNDGRLVEVGQTYTVDCEPVLCEQGLHGSVRLIDALKYAPGPILCVVDITGQVQKGDDKIVGTSRKVLRMADVSDQLREFSRKVAYDVWVKYFPDDPENVVVKWLTTGDESLRSAAWSAAESAAESAADSAAESAADSAAESAADSAADSAAESAAWSAARFAAESAAWSAAESAARFAARSAQNKLLLRLVREADWEIMK